MESVIDKIIQTYFPDELQDPANFEDWSEVIRENANPEATNLLYVLEKQLDLLKDICLEEDHIHRDCWEMFGGTDKLLKSAESIRSKLARDIYEDYRHKKKELWRQTAEQLACRVYAFGDLGRIRIVADFPSDIDCLQENLLKAKKFLDIYKCPKGVKDFIFDPKLRDGFRGHRARQFSVRVPIDTELAFGFEVQLMTRLQHAWDRRNHPLYEWQREHPDWQGDKKAVQLAVDDFACAEALHLVDRQADLNWVRLKKNFIMRGRS